MTKQTAEVTAIELNQVAAVEAGRISLEGPLTIIGGKNNEGKTGSLNMIMATLCGNKHVPSRVVHDDKETGEVTISIKSGDEEIKVVKTFRKDGKPLLKLYTPHGTVNSGVQGTLDQLFDPIALDARPFLNLPETDKAEVLLKNAGVDVEKLDQQIQSAFDNRRYYNRQLKEAKAQFAKCEYDPDYPESFPKTGDVVRKLEEARAHNRKLDELKSRKEQGYKFISNKQDEVERIRQQLKEAENALQAAENRMAEIDKQIDEFEPQDTSKLETALEENETVQQKVQANKDYRESESKRDEAYANAQDAEGRLEELRERRRDQLSNSNLPEHISIVKDEKGNNVPTYKGDRWDTMSTSDRYFMALEQSRLNKPACNLVLVDGLECMDTEKLQVYRDFIMKHDLKVLATRVTQQKDDCDLLIEEGRFLEKGEPQDFNPEEPKVRGRKTQEPESEISEQENQPDVNNAGQTKDSELPDF